MRHQQLVHIDAERNRQPFQIVQGNISDLALDMRNECPVQARLECKGFL